MWGGRSCNKNTPLTGCLIVGLDTDFSLVSLDPRWGGTKLQQEHSQDRFLNVLSTFFFFTLPCVPRRGFLGDSGRYWFVWSQPSHLGAAAQTFLGFGALFFLQEWWEGGDTCKINPYVTFLGNSNSSGRLSYPFFSRESPIIV